MTNEGDRTNRVKPVALILSNFFPPESVGGAELVAEQQAIGLRERGYEVHVVTGGKPSAHAESDTRSGLVIHRVGLSSLDPYGSMTNSFATAYIRSLIKATRPRVALAHNMAGLGLDTLQEVTTSVPTFAWFHDFWAICLLNTTMHDGRQCTSPYHCGLLHGESGASGARSFVRTSSIVSAYSRAHGLVSPSGFLRRQFRSSGVPLEILVRSNGSATEVRARSHQSRSTLRVCYAGYLGAHKGVPVLLEALREAASRGLGDSLEVHILGDGYLADEVSQAARDLHEFVTYHGRVPHSEAMSRMRDSDVLLVPSCWPENEPVSILDAQAAGLAVIGTDLGGIPDLVGTDCGQLIAPESTGELLRSLEVYVSDRRTLERHSARALERAQARRSASDIDDILTSEVPPQPLSSSRIILDGGHKGWPAYDPTVFQELASPLVGQVVDAESATIEDWRLSSGLVLTQSSFSWTSLRRAVSLGLPVAYIRGLTMPESLLGIPTTSLASIGQLATWSSATAVRTREQEPPWLRKLRLDCLPDVAFALEEDAAWLS